MIAEISLPEVKPLLQSARFFRQKVGDAERDFVEVSFVGSKDTLVEKVTPGHMAQFRAEWDAYCDGKPPQRRAGIALTELAAIDAQRAEHYIARNIHNLEELAALNDAQCQSVGHGALTDRKAALGIVARRRFEARDKLRHAVNQASAAIGPKPAEQYAASSELDALKGELADLKKTMAIFAKSTGELVEAVTAFSRRIPEGEGAKRGPGRPKKEQGAEPLSARPRESGGPVAK